MKNWSELSRTNKEGIINTMAEQKAKVILEGVDNTGKAFDSAQRNVSSFSGQVSSLAKVLGGLFVAKQVGDFLIGTAKGAAEAETSLARVDSTLKAMGSAAQENRQKILQLADATVKLGFDDEAAAESITKLYQRTGDLTKANELNNLAMDLARAKNVDLATATNLVGQVLSGNGRVLKQYGIELDETKTPLEALGQLHDQVSGQAAAFADTTQGRMLTLSESFSNLRDKIGFALNESLKPFIDAFSKWVSDPKNQQKIQEIADKIVAFAKFAIPIAITGIKLLWSVFKFLYDLLVDFEVKIMQIIDRLVQVVEKAKAAASAVGGAVGGAVKGTVNFVTAPFRAQGGPVSMGSPYIVGERGPELFVPGQSGRIIPNGGSGAVVNIYNPLMLDDTYIDKVGQQIARILGRDLRY